MSTVFFTPPRRHSFARSRHTIQNGLHCAPFAERFGNVLKRDAAALALLAEHASHLARRRGPNPQAILTRQSPGGPAWLARVSERRISLDHQADPLEVVA